MKGRENGLGNATKRKNQPQRTMETLSFSFGKAQVHFVEGVGFFGPALPQNERGNAAKRKNQRFHKSIYLDILHSASCLVNALSSITIVSCYWHSGHVPT